MLEKVMGKGRLVIMASGWSPADSQLARSSKFMPLMSSLLFGVSPLDPVTYVLVPIGLLGAAFVASYLPARRATVIDPVQALRSE